jgi:hypothetical protein
MYIYIYMYIGNRIGTKERDTSSIVASMTTKMAAPMAMSMKVYIYTCICIYIYVYLYV